MAAARRGSSVLEAAPAFSSTLVCTPLLLPHSQHLSSTCHPEPSTPCCFAMSPVPTLLSLPAAQPCHCLLSFYSPHITSFTLSPSSLSFKLLDFPDPVWMYPYSPPSTYQFCQTPTSFPHLKRNPAPNHVTIPRLQPQLCFTKEI